MHKPGSPKGHERADNADATALALGNCPCALRCTVFGDQSFGDVLNVFTQRAARDQAIKGPTKAGKRRERIERGPIEASANDPKPNLTARLRVERTENLTDPRIGPVT